VTVAPCTRYCGGLALLLVVGAVINVVVAWSQTQLDRVVQPTGIGLNWHEVFVQNDASILRRAGVSAHDVHVFGGGYRSQHWRGRLVGLELEMNAPATPPWHALIYWETGFPMTSMVFVKDFPGSLWAINHWRHGSYRRIAPIWSGFAINTIAYATFLGLFFVPGAVRRHFRARRGQCPKCGYMIGESAVCTECGCHLARRVPDHR